MNLINLRTYSLFFGIVFANLILTLSLNYLLVSDNLIFNEYSSQLSFERITELIESNKKYKYITFLLVPLIYLIKFSSVALFLTIGNFFLKDKLEFKKIFKVVIICEIVFLIPIIIKIFWFLFVQTDYSLGNLKSFSPLSLINFFELDKIEKWVRYPLRLFNIFEIIYCFFLAFNLKDALSISLQNAFLVVITSYGSAILLWVVFITFLSLNAA